MVQNEYVLNIKIFLIFLSTIILFYLIINPNTLKYYFENALGKLSLLFFIITITYVVPLFGIISSLILIFIYNSKVFVIEGMNSSKKNENEEKTTEKKEPEEGELDTLPIDTNQNKKVDLEKSIQPKDSNTIPVTKNSIELKEDEQEDPKPHNS
jgi:hypothetical protein